MRKVLIRVNMNIPKEDLAELEKKLKKDFENGLVIIPWYCSGYVVEDDMTEVSLKLCGPTSLDEPVILQPLKLTEQITEQIKKQNVDSIGKNIGGETS